MSPERNAPCPCGSGKKYKKCCGLSEVRRTDYIGVNRAIAYRGAIGRARQVFCEGYSAQKKTRIAAIEDGLRRDLTAQSKTISCGKGCTHCCDLFVVASLQECEAIIHYLYNHEYKLTHFLRAFDTWKDRIFRVERCFGKINDLHQKITAGQATDEDRKRFDDECGSYARAGIACPFIMEGACSIYEVRPYVCAGVVAITPQDWCAAEHPRHLEASYYKSSLKSNSEMPYFLLPEPNEIFASMPSLVYNLLKDGYAALSAIPGLEKLEEKALSDPEVRTILNLLYVGALNS